MVNKHTKICLSSSILQETQIMLKSSGHTLPIRLENNKVMITEKPARATLTKIITTRKSKT